MVNWDENYTIVTINRPSLKKKKESSTRVLGLSVSNGTLVSLVDPKKVVLWDSKAAIKKATMRLPVKATQINMDRDLIALGGEGT